MKRVAAGLAALCLVAVGALFLSEAFAVDVRGVDYNFGTEAMIGHGGWSYRSAKLYVVSALLEGLPLMGAGVMLAVYAWKPKRPLPIAAAVLVVVAVALLVFRMMPTE